MPPNSPPHSPDIINKAAAFSEEPVQQNDISNRYFTNVGEARAERSANDIAEDLCNDEPLFNQLYNDAPEHRLLHSPDALLRHQQLRIARSSTLLNHRFRLSGVLLGPLVTVGCVSICRSHLQQLLQPTASPQQPELSLDRLELKCGFCNASILVTDILSRIANPENAQCTAEFLKLLAKEHAIECRGRNAAEQLYAEDAQFGVSESSSNQNASVSNLNGTKNYNYKVWFSKSPF